MLTIGKEGGQPWTATCGPDRTSRWRPPPTPARPSGCPTRPPGGARVPVGGRAPEADVVGVRPGPLGAVGPPPGPPPEPADHEPAAPGGPGRAAPGRPVPAVPGRPPGRVGEVGRRVPPPGR